jgi:hypothetical protein
VFQAPGRPDAAGRRDPGFPAGVLWGLETGPGPARPVFQTLHPFGNPYAASIQFCRLSFTGVFGGVLAMRVYLF